jgi:hypothetical protein
VSQEIDDIFIGLVKESWKHYNETKSNSQMDELLVGSVIASCVDEGYSLIDLTSDGVNHYLRFEFLSTKQRIIFQLQNLSEDLVTAKVLGHRARIIIGYGEMVNNVSAIWSAAKSEFKSGYLDVTEPGVITVDADVAAGYIYVQVPLILNLDKYLGQDYEVNTQLMQKHLHATVASLQKYLRGRFSS